MTLTSSKQLLRSQMRARLAALSDAEIQRQSALVCARVVKMPAFQQAQRISIYLSMRKEVQTAALLEHIFSAGKTCFVPRCKGDEMQMVRLHSREDWLNLPKNSWGIPEPDWDEEREQAGELDLVILPGLAFDRQCWRLGHGKGYYDRFLASMRDRHGHMPETVALALDDQIMGDGEIPHEEHDIRPQCLATPAALITNLLMNE